jgi:hypothetical protein
MQIGRILPGVATLGGKIFVVGGERGSQILANGEVYDPQVNQMAYTPDETIHFWIYFRSIHGNQ